jgi:LEA14-like dessication related protein
LQEPVQNNRFCNRLLILPFFLALCTACKSAPKPPPLPPPPEPAVSLAFDHIEAESINKATVYYLLTIDNLHTVPANFALRNWYVTVYGIELEKESSTLTNNGAPADTLTITAAPQNSAEALLALDLDLQPFHGQGSLPGSSDISDDYRAKLVLDFSWQYEKEKPKAYTAEADAIFPRIQEPEFTITSIAILQAELINTRFRVKLRIDNPNIFPVDLSSFGYSLYGDGRFWADGKEKNVLHVPGKGSAETSLFLVMNFINMKRSLLDEVIAMALVNYRFAGEVEVGTGISYLPEFHMKFDQSGKSEVFY